MSDVIQGRIPKIEVKGRVGFAVGTGRCGTHFVAKLMAREPGVTSSHERNSMSESFHRYSQWYDLPIDQEGFLQVKEDEICQDLADHRFSFEASAYLSLSICELYERFDAKFVLLVRRPDQMVKSFWNKGWYERPYVQANLKKALGYQQHLKAHHFFARIAPKGSEFDSWNGLSQVGKLGWFWSVLNLRALEQFARIPTTHWRVVKVEELSYATYLELASFLGVKSQLTEQSFIKIANSRPGTRPRVHVPTNWSEREIAEFEMQVSTAATQFGYEYRVGALPPEQRPHTQPQFYLVPNVVRKICKRFSSQVACRQQSHQG